MGFEPLAVSGRQRVLEVRRDEIHGLTADDRFLATPEHGLVPPQFVFDLSANAGAAAMQQHSEIPFRNPEQSTYFGRR
jgi:hypothetical protein